ncbi:NADH-ubiquinone oxidoreductase [Smittium culicis]|uniref:NADH-ubiquinone oxidoreductase n=1 Tax=Smittium culicis TaxID=133412 RepID=A0A1R1XKI6_9FUNG|nr:NADH-ubiquinone oxidoreductase [Smittium culicis]OMJ15130.1 NADH-ubiquinone oxidoreductase [Smittium culicis]
MPVISPAVSTFSKTKAATRLRTIHLYRRWQKAVPTIIIDYRLSIPQAEVRAKVRSEFEKKRHLTDLPSINIALFKGNAEFEETLNCWKQVNHVYNYFTTPAIPITSQHHIDAPTSNINSSFVGKFLSGQN